MLQGSISPAAEDALRSSLEGRVTPSGIPASELEFQSAARLVCLSWALLRQGIESLDKVPTVGWRVVLRQPADQQIVGTADIEGDVEKGFQFAGFEEGPYVPLIADTLNHLEAMGWQSSIIMVPSVRVIAVQVRDDNRYVIVLDPFAVEATNQQREVMEDQFLEEVAGEAERLAELAGDAP